MTNFFQDYLSQILNSQTVGQGSPLASAFMQRGQNNYVGPMRGETPITSPMNATPVQSPLGMNDGGAERMARLRALLDPMLNSANAANQQWQQQADAFNQRMMQQDQNLRQQYAQAEQQAAQQTAPAQIQPMPAPAPTRPTSWGVASPVTSMAGESPATYAPPGESF